MHIDIQNAANIGQDRPTLGRTRGGLNLQRGAEGGGAFHVNGSLQGMGGGAVSKW